MMPGQAEVESVFLLAVVDEVQRRRVRLHADAQHAGLREREPARPCARRGGSRPGGRPAPSTARCVAWRRSEPAESWQRQPIAIRPARVASTPRPTTNNRNLPAASQPHRRLQVESSIGPSMPLMRSGRAARREYTARGLRSGAADLGHDRLGGVRARLRRAVHVALKIVAAVLAGEEQIPDRQSFRARDRRPLARLVAGVAALGPRKVGQWKRETLPLRSRRRARIGALDARHEARRRGFGRSLPDVVRELAA